MTDALVLAGAAVQGAFTAGALSVLSEPETQARLGLNIGRIVGASSGALNGTYFAAAVRRGDEAAAGPRLARLWVDEANLGNVLDPSLHDVIATLGLSTDSKVLSLLRRHVQPAAPGGRPIELRLIITNVEGQPIPVDGRAATTFEHVVHLTGPDFDTAEALERVFLAAAASAALPGLFAPVTLPLGDRTVRGFDGGLVDDTPLGHALRGAPEVDRVFVVAPFPRVRAVSPSLHGLALALHVLDIVIDERLVRDLRHVARVNDVMARLEPLLPDPAQRASVLQALGWADRRPVRVVEIRPDGELPGDSLSGFTSRPLRQQYVQAGIEAARRALEP
jgi:predicted acylesterase/phospholipase RssA